MAKESDVLEGFTNLEKQLERFGNEMKGALEKSHLNHRNNTLAYLEDDTDFLPDEPAQKGNAIRKMAGSTVSKRVQLALRKANYKSQFKSHSEALQMMARKPSQYQERYSKSIEALTKANAMNTIDSESAGSLVLPEFAPEIMSVLYDNNILSMTNQFTVGGNRMSFPRLQETSRAQGSRNGGMYGAWLEEGDTIPTTRPSVGETELKLKKLAVVVFLTEEMIDDNSYMLENWVRQAVQRELAFMIGDAIFNGTGAKRPMGILNSTGTVSVAARAGQSAGTIIAGNIEDMYSRMRFGNADLSKMRWFLNQDTFPQLNAMTVGTGASAAPVFLPAGNLASAPFGSLKGIPIMPTEFNSTCGTVGDICLANLDNYLTISKGGVQESSSIHVEFLREQVAFKFTMRIDGRPLFDQPTTPYKGTATQGDFITVATRA
jgi:HK97 family phage major capsid protein